jgi:hypothetical protein
MADNDEVWKPWPPADCAAFLKEIEDAWKAKSGSGKHWIVKVDGTNPLSGYCVKKQAAGGG